MSRKPLDRVAVGRTLLWASALCLTASLLGGCCTVRCCMSEKCAEATLCASPQVRVLMVVKSRVDGCPDVWVEQLKVRAGDRVKLVNCSGQPATVKFSSPDLFGGSDTFSLAPDATRDLTVSPGVPTSQAVGILVEGVGPCGHGGSTIIVSDGP